MNLSRRIQHVFCLFMKISLTQLVLLTLFASLVSAAEIKGQEALERRISIDAVDEEIGSVLEEIEEQAFVTFSYRTRTIRDSAKTTLHVTDEPLGNVLKQLFDGSVKIEVRDNEILIKPRPIPAVPGVIPDEDKVVAARMRVSGVVRDETGQSLPGVNVVEKETVNGTTTDVDGRFSLEVEGEKSVLVFSFIGYQTFEVLVGSQTAVTVTLQPDIQSLDEVVVVGYGEQKKATLTGSVASISSESLTQRPSANTTELLQGQVAGLVTRQSSGLPGADGTTLNIRGFGNPLIIVDGIQTGLAQVDPNDIESISVLKDASAAVYGARAGNGVILVTTKRGAEKPSEISYNGSVSFTQPTFLAEMVNARQWAEMLDEAGLNPEDYSPAYISYDPNTKRLINDVDGSDFQGYNWAKALYRNWTPQHQHNLSASGGNKKTRYFVSAGITSQESNFKSGDYDFSRYNIRSNIDASVTDDLSVSVDFAYYSTLLDKANFDVSDVFNLVNSSRPVYPYVHEADPSKAAFSGGARTPYYKTFRDYSGFVENRENVLRGILGLKYSFPMVKGLVAQARLTYEDAFSWDKNVSKPFDVWAYDPIAAANNADPWTRQGIEGVNTMFVFADRFNKLLPLFSLEYEKTMGNHYIKALVASETWTTHQTTLRGDRKNVLSFEAPYLNYASQEGKDNSESVTKKARTSFVGRVNYDYMAKFLLEVAMRADASAEYPPKGRWGYFPSVSAGWRISEEPFFRDNINGFDNLKLRASHGILGYDAVSSYDYLTGYNITTDYYIFGTTPGPVINSAGLANPDITWETMKISNIGLDGSLWAGKLGFELDVFYRRKEDILAEPITQVPSTFGASLPRTNMNKMDNRGFEISLNHAGKIGNFSYDISPMFSWTRGKYVSIDENILPITDDMDEETKEFNRLWNARNVREGHWDDRLWGYVNDGFFMTQQEIDEYTIDQDQNGNQTIRVGDLKYKDLNGDNYIDWRDEQVIAKGGLPNVMYSLNMGAQFKGLSIRMLWQGAADYSVTFTDRAAAPFHSEGIPLKEHYQHRAILGVDSEGNEYIANAGDFKLPPVTQNGRTVNNAKASDFWTYNARFLRLKNLNISYTLPKSLVTKSGFKQCTFYVSGTNLFAVSNLGIWKKAFDPETSVDPNSNAVVNNRNYPPVKTLTLGLRLRI